MFRSLSFLVPGLLLSGCAALAPVSSSFTSLLGERESAGIHGQTRVNLTGDNFTLVKTNVCGRSKGFSLLGLVTICPASLTTAMSRMYAAAQMRPGRPQTVAHLIVERSSSYWILFGIPRVEASADIVEFLPAVTTRESVKPEPRPAKPPD